MKGRRTRRLGKAQVVCRYCGHDMALCWGHIFRGTGKEHVRAECARCSRFVQFVRRGEVQQHDPQVHERTLFEDELAAPSECPF